MLRVGLHRDNFNYLLLLDLVRFLRSLLLLSYTEATVLKNPINKQSIRTVSHNGETEQVLRDPSHLQRTKEPAHHLLAY